MINTQDLVTSVSDDRLITVLVGEGEDQEKFMLQDTFLRRTSRVFSAALNNEHLGEGAKSVLKLPEDDVKAWRVLVFWMFNEKLPEEDLGAETGMELQSLLAQCWTLGDKYEIPTFQDLIMLELLQYLNSKVMTPEAAEQAVANTTPQSKLRILAGREVARYASICEERDTYKYNGALSGHGFAAEVLDVTRAGMEGLKAATATYIARRKGRFRKDTWRDFMVAGGPGKHWIHNVRNDASED